MIKNGLYFVSGFLAAVYFEQPQTKAGMACLTVSMLLFVCRDVNRDTFKP